MRILRSFFSGSRSLTATTALAAALLAAPCQAGTEKAQDYDARLAAAAGTVDVLAGGEGDGWREAEEGMPLSQGDRVRTGGGSSAEITLDDGGVMRLGPDSEADISSLAPESSSFSLKFGSLVAKIRAGFIKAGGRMAVRTPTAVCAVRGTEFGVEYDQASGETTAGVFDEGRLSVASTDEAGNTLAEQAVGKGEEVRLKKGAKAFKAAAMRRLSRHRKGLDPARKRLAALRGAWKRLDPEKRAELRKRFMTRKALKGLDRGKRREELRKAVKEKVERRAPVRKRPR